MMNDAPVVIQNYKVHTYIRTYAQREDEGGEREREERERGKKVFYLQGGGKDKLNTAAANHQPSPDPCSSSE